MYFCKMKYTEEIKINKNLDEVIAVFEDEKSLQHWQRGLINTRTVKGKSGEIGSLRKLKIDLDIRTVIMREEITHKNLPHEWFATYKSTGMISTQKNYFKQVGSSTIWTSKSEFKFSGFMKMISKVLPSIFRQRSVLVMKDFKDYIEHGNSATEK